MYNLFIASALSVTVFVGTSAFLGPWAGVVPGVLVWGVVTFLLTRRTGQRVEAEMAVVLPLLQAGKVDEARAQLEVIRGRWANWQLLLDGSIDAQLGMLEYAQRKWDAALPLLERGRTRNWMAQTCIACIHFRQGRRDACWDEMSNAASAAGKEAMVYMVWAVLATRAGERTRALDALTQGLEQVPDSEPLKNLKNTIANKKKIKTRGFGDAWYQFFPEDLVTRQLMRGRKDGGSPVQMPVQRPGAKALFRGR